MDVKHQHKISVEQKNELKPKNCWIFYKNIYIICNII